MAEYITSRSNDLIKKIRKLLSDGAYRREERLIVCDGWKLLEEAFRWGNIKIITRTDTARLPAWYNNKIDSNYSDKDNKIREILIPEEIMKSVAPSKTPQGVLCVCDTPDYIAPEEELKKNINKKRIYLILDGMQDPGNVGTILRTADAFGADGVFLLSGCADLFHPRTIRASMGAIWKLNIWNMDFIKFADLIKKYKVLIYGAAARDNAADIRGINQANARADLNNLNNLNNNAIAIVIGSEGRGISDEVAALCDGMLKIPMRKDCESLNAAMAAGIALWELSRDKI